MNINVFDAVIVLLILMSGVVGFKRGVFKQLVMTVGTLIIYFIAFKLKNPVADFLSLNLPFIKFSNGAAIGSVLNIIFYQSIAFILVATVLLFIFQIIIKVTNLFEKVLNFTIILGAISKILGFIVGVVEGYVIVFVLVFFLKQPSINAKVINESILMPKMLENTPVLSESVKDTYDSVQEVYELNKKYKDLEDDNQFALESLDVLLKHKVVEPSYIDKLIEKDKVNISNVSSVLNKYR